MYKWLYIIGGGLIGLLVKKEIDKLTRPNHIADWPPDVRIKDATGHSPDISPIDLAAHDIQSDS